MKNASARTDTLISPVIAKWLYDHYEVKVVSFFKLNFHTTSDYSIFMQAKENNVIFPKAGNISDADLITLLSKPFQKAIDLIVNHNYHLTEITTNV
jgi:predicted nuclease of predicted toxin-antitoxin system